MRNNFIIINTLEELDKYLNKIYLNFPKKEYVLKEEIEKVIKNIYFNIYRIVYNYKYDLAIETISLIKHLNNLIDSLYQKKIINNNKYLSIGNLLIKITKLLRGYINEKNKRSI